MRNLILIALSAAAICGCHDSSVSGSNSDLGNPPPKNHAPPIADALDTRTPLPLLPRMAQHQRENMRDHLAAVQEIIDAISKNDFGGVETSAAKIGFSEQMQEMCKHMGMGAPGFTDMALNFHRTADSIGAAARKQDERDVLKALSATVSTCVACHAIYRQQVVDEATWHRLMAEKK